MPADHELWSDAFDRRPQFVTADVLEAAGMRGVHPVAITERRLMRHENVHARGDARVYLFERARPLVNAQSMNVFDPASPNTISRASPVGESTARG